MIQGEWAVTDVGRAELVRVGDRGGDVRELGVAEQDLLRLARAPRAGQQYPGRPPGRYSVGEPLEPGVGEDRDGVRRGPKPIQRAWGGRIERRRDPTGRDQAEQRRPRVQRVDHGSRHGRARRHVRVGQPLVPVGDGRGQVAVANPPRAARVGEVHGVPALRGRLLDPVGDLTDLSHGHAWTLGG